MLEALEVMRRMLLCMMEVAEGGLFFAGGVGSDTLCGTLYAEGCGG